MNMYRILLALALSASIGTAFAEEIVSERKVGFQAEYEDGVKENMVVKYSAIAHEHHNNTGSASKGITHLQDTRRCIWKVYSYIQRDVCVSTRTAGEICEGKYTKIFNDGRSGTSKSQNLLEGRFDATTCGDMMGKINANYSTIKNNVIVQLNDVIKNDLEGLFSTLENSGGIKRVIRK